MEGRVVGRYVIYDEIASGGMATVHIGRLLGPVGFARTVALKRLHPQFAKDPEFVAMFLDEARIAARIRHPNVVSTLDVVAVDKELFLVMDYVQGESLSRLMRPLRAREQAIPPRTAATIMYEALLGLHAAHEATDDGGQPLSIVHRDVSPQNVLVGADGISRVVDFGVAKAVGRAQTTREGQVKGKVAYMAPEQLRGGAVDRRTDVYAAAVVLWEILAGRRLFAADSPAASMTQVLERQVEPPSAHAPGISRELDALVLRGMARDPAARFATAREMATRLEEIAGREPATAIGDWVQGNARAVLEERQALIVRVESQSASTGRPVAVTEDVATTPSIGGTSSASVPRPSRRPRARTWMILGLSAVGVVAVAGAATRQLTTARAAPPAAGAVATAMGEPSTSALAPGPAGVASVAPAAATASAPGSTSSSAEGSAVASAAPAPARPARPTPASRHPTPARSTPARAGCNPPFTVDANGYHIPKPQCL